MLNSTAPFLLLLGFMAGPADSDPQGIQGFLQRYCVECHGAEVQKARLRLDTLSMDLSKSETRRHWGAILEQVRSEAMPPPKKPKPSQEELKHVQNWIEKSLARMEQEQRKIEGRSLIRRLSRSEYVNTIQDLLGISADLADLLPEDPTANGFENVDQALTLSPVLLERYLAAADVALDAAIVKGPRPALTNRHIVFKDSKHIKSLIGDGALVGQTEDAALLYNGVYSTYEIVELFNSKPGTYRFRIKVHAHNSGEKSVLFRIYVGDFTPGQGKSHFVGFFEAHSGKPSVIEIQDRLVNPRDTIKLVPYGLQNPWKKIAEFKGAGLAVHSIDVEGPLHDTWPPPGHRRLFGETNLNTAGIKEAESLLSDFLPRAFRRPVASSEIAAYRDLVQKQLQAGQTFPAAMRVAYKAILCSPNFLFLQFNPGKLDPYALATRLSYFLWCTLPDERLLNLAQAGTLSQPQILQAEVERMLVDRRAQRLIKSFTGQWLGLKNLDATAPDTSIYPEYDELLRESMPRETEAFFQEILKNDRSLIEFVDSDWAMLNERLAHHYGIKGVQGLPVHKVKLPPGSHRGGVLTQASVLKVTANGTNSSPVIRGNWVLDRILGKPSPAPPPGVPAVEPDIRGATSIREQLARHRTVEGCAGCHSKIDPPGFALENFDVIGGYRDRYRIKPPKGTKADLLTLEINGGKRWIPLGVRIDASATMPDGEHLVGIEGLKRWLLKDPDPLALALMDKLLTTATGHVPDLEDRPLMMEILGKIRFRNLGLRSLIHEVIQSPLFLNK